MAAPLSLLRPTTISRSGHTLQLDNGSVSVHGPDGKMQVEVVLDEDRARVLIHDANIQIEAINTLALNCRTFHLDATDSATLYTGGALSLHADGGVDIAAGTDLRAVAPMIWLN